MFVCVCVCVCSSVWVYITNVSMVLSAVYAHLCVCGMLYPGGKVRMVKTSVYGCRKVFP